MLWSLENISNKNENSNKTENDENHNKHPGWLGLIIYGKFIEYYHILKSDIPAAFSINWFTNCITVNVKSILRWEWLDFRW